MVRGLYSAASGALVAQNQVDNVANNLANVNSSGFKQTLLQVSSGPSLELYRIQSVPAGGSSTQPLASKPAAPYVGPLGTGAMVYDTPEDFSQGALQQTGNPLDVALTGANGFFAVNTANGVRYTRDGQFSINANGTLVTADGNPVLGTNGTPIAIQPQLGQVAISPDGTISQSPPAGQTAGTNQILGQLQVVSMGNLLQLRKEGDNNFVNTGNAQPAATTAVGVQQGFLEKSNGNVVRSMVDLITAERWFDANERVMKAQDDAVNQAISQVGKTTS